MTDSSFDYPFQIRLQDVDAAGVLFFAQLFPYAHSAYEQWMAELGFPLHRMIRERTLGLPLVHAEADYRRPLRHGDAVTARLTIAELAERRFAVAYRFETAGGALAAEARTLHVALDPQTGKSCPLPADLAAALRPYVQAPAPAE